MKERRIDNKKDLLLLFLYSPGLTEKTNEPIRGRTRLEKLIFVFKMEGFNHFKKGIEVNEDTFYDFFPWNFGPFSSEIYNDLLLFQLRGFIKYESIVEDGIDIANEEMEYWNSITGIEYENEYLVGDYIDQEIVLTEKGANYAEDLYLQLSKSQHHILKMFKKKFNSAPLRSIIMYVYNKYPDYAKNSQIRNNILGIEDGEL